MPQRFFPYVLPALTLSLYYTATPAYQTFISIFISSPVSIKTNNISTHIKNKFPNAISRVLL